MKLLGAVEELAIVEPQSYEIEIWNYSPLLFAENEIVDRCSLYLSMLGSTDERVVAALEEMMEKVKW